ncbi:hypothetical protein V8G54_002817 [Vigna mungo]|uniref:Uncharacterized protein n=1 Tax=Vigna mungo TaxID=3915 RepID=A0AAQ3SCA2_VIGMU
MSCVTSSAMLRPSISVWGLTETALQTTGEGDEILVTSGVEERPLPGLSDVAVETVVKGWRVGAREEQVNELTKEAEAIVVDWGNVRTNRRLGSGERRRLMSAVETDLPN